MRGLREFVAKLEEVGELTNAGDGAIEMKAVQVVGDPGNGLMKRPVKLACRSIRWRLDKTCRCGFAVRRNRPSRRRTGSCPGDYSPRGIP